MNLTTETFQVTINEDYFLPIIVIDILSDDKVVVDRLGIVSTGDVLQSPGSNMLVRGIETVEDLFEDYHILEVSTVSNIPGVTHTPKIGDEFKIIGNAKTEK